MSQSRTFEGRTIEEALRTAAAELGPDVEVVDAAKERRGGVFGFFAKERFVVTAHEHDPAPAEQDHDFGDLLLQMADEISDTYETGLVEQEDPALAAIEARARRAIEGAPTRTEPGSIGVIDLREGKRVGSTRPQPASEEASPFSFGQGERPSQLRRRLETRPAATQPTEGGAHIVPGPIAEVADTSPAWSIAALRRIGLPESVITVVADFDPASDIEWMHAIAIAVGRLLPDQPSRHLNHLVGSGRASAVDLIRGIESGLLPAHLIIDGRAVRATPDELAQSIRECLR